MLAKRKVEVARAVWFVRAFGGVEIVSAPLSFSCRRRLGLGAKGALAYTRGAETPQWSGIRLARLCD